MDENLDLIKNVKIEEALKEFEEKNSEQVQTVQQEPSVLTSSVSKKFEKPEPSKTAKLVMKLSCGLVKEEQQAEYVLLIFGVLILIASLFFWTGIIHF